jgi:hypothetical protein
MCEPERKEQVPRRTASACKEVIRRLNKKRTIRGTDLGTEGGTQKAVTGCLAVTDHRTEQGRSLPALICSLKQTI